VARVAKAARAVGTPGRVEGGGIVWWLSWMGLMIESSVEYGYSEDGMRVLMPLMNMGVLWYWRRLLGVDFPNDGSRVWKSSAFGFRESSFPNLD
jgi:hypothetical protein